MKTNLEKKYIIETKKAHKDFLIAHKKYEKAKQKYGDTLKKFVKENIHHTQKEFEEAYALTIENEIEREIDSIESYPSQYFDPFKIYDSMVWMQIFLIDNEEIPDIELNKKKMGAK